MKFRELSRFSGDWNYDGVVLFAQLLDEMLFDYTMDTYKPSALSPGLICVEALQLAQRIERGIFGRERMIPVVEELEHALKTDFVAKHLLEFEPSFYVKFDKDDSTADLKNRLGLLRNRIGSDVYIPKCESMLIEALAAPKEKKLIRALGRAWASAAICSGHHKSFLEESVRTFFFDPSRTIHAVSDVGDFFSSARGAGREYEIVFAVSPLFRHIEDRCSEFRCKLSQQCPVPETMANLAWGAQKSDQVFLSTKTEELPDIHSARQSAEKLVETISDLFVLFHHQQKLSWLKAGVGRPVEGEWRVVSAPASALRKTLDYRPTKASRRMGEMMQNLALHPEAMRRFASIVRLHGVAADAETPEVQLVKLWTALEVIIPTGSHSKLKGVIDSLMPPLLLGYPESLFLDLLSDLTRWDSKQRFRRYVGKMKFPKDWRLVHKLAAIVLLPEYKEQREWLYSFVNEFVLLRFRLFSLQERFANPGKILEVLDAHEQRVSWQITRIYRARNLIVHLGQRPVAIDALAENAHSYVDAFVNKVIELSVLGKQARSVDQATALLQERRRRWQRTLKASDALTMDNLAPSLSGKG